MRPSNLARSWPFIDQNFDNFGQFRFPFVERPYKPTVSWFFHFFTVMPIWETDFTESVNLSGVNFVCKLGLNIFAGEARVDAWLVYFEFYEYVLDGWIFRLVDHIRITLSSLVEICGYNLTSSTWSLLLRRLVDRVLSWWWDDQKHEQRHLHNFYWILWNHFYLILIIIIF